MNGARTPFVKAGGAFKDVHVSDLARRVIQEALYRSDFPFERLDEVILGNVVMPADATNLARVAALWAGVPENVPALTVQRNCASGMESIAQAGDLLRAGRGHAVLAGGAESMSGLPLLLPDETREPMSRMYRARNFWQRTTAAASFRPRHFKPRAALELGLTDPTCGLIMGKTAEILASEFGITREQQDAFALRSHQRAAAAIESGKFDAEIVPVFATDRFVPISRDVGPRANQTTEALAKLRPIFEKRDGTVTAGNSSQVTDGAAAVLVMDGETAGREEREPLGFVRGYACVGLDPKRMGLGPAYAINKLLSETGVSLAEVDLFEINEAFAAQVLACLKAMGSAEFCRSQLNRSEALGEIDPDRLNVNGGAIALGHPVGATGTRLVLTLLMEMKRRKVNLGVAALCVGGGQGVAMLLERGS
jgi:acetyl-CoA acetyltransferase family protein